MAEKTAEKTPKAPRSPIGGTIPSALREAFEDFRWSKRLTVSDALELALKEFAAKHFPSDAPDEAPVSDSAPEPDVAGPNPSRPRR